MFTDKVKSFMQSPEAQKTLAVFRAAKEEVVGYTKKAALLVWNKTKEAVVNAQEVPAVCYTAIGVIGTIAMAALQAPVLFIPIATATALWGAGVGHYFYKKNEDAIQNWRPFKPRPKVYKVDSDEPDPQF